MIIRPANRTQMVEEYYFSRKLEEIAVLRSAGHHVINLGIGSPDLPPPDAAIARLRADALLGNVHGYQSYRGIPDFRKAIADWMKRVYGTSLLPETEILPLIGSKEGIMHISMAFLNPGDVVHVPDPGYPTYTSVSKLCSAEIQTYSLTAASHWQPDFGQLRDSILPTSKILWLNYPNMPTGVKATKKLLDNFVQLAHDKKILLVNDNPYSLILNDHPLSILACDGAKDVAIELNSLSKSHHMAGWRIGWVCGSVEYIRTLLKVKSNMDSGQFYPLQTAAIAALQEDERWHQKANAVYTARQGAAIRLLTALGCDVETEQGGLFVWAKKPEAIGDVSLWVDEMLNQHHVFISPGFIFGKNGSDYLRVSLCNPVSEIEAATKRLTS